MAGINEIRAIIGGPGEPPKMRELLNALGGITSAEFQANFERQSFGGNPWEPRYPNQDEPFVNIAKLVQVLNEGGNPVGVFDRTPALMGDPPVLMNSIGWRITDDLEAEVGVDFNITPASGAVSSGGSHPASYAGIHNEGEESTQEVTDGTKRALQKWLEGVTSDDTFDEIRDKRQENRDSRQIIRETKEQFKAGEIEKEDRDQVIENEQANISNRNEDIGRMKRRARPQQKGIRDKVGFLFAIDSLTTQVVKRQFIGVTPQLEKDVADFVKLFIERSGRVRPAQEFGG